MSIFRRIPSLPPMTASNKLLATMVVGFGLALAGCQKDEPTPPIAPGPAPASCGIDGARLQATFDGAAFCANVSLFASDAAGTITISGMSTQGSTLTLEIDSMSVGTHAITENTNAMLHTTTLAMSYTAMDALPGTLTIESHDLVLKRIKGTFSASLQGAFGGPPKTIIGSFDVFYVD